MPTACVFTSVDCPTIEQVEASTHLLSNETQPPSKIFVEVVNRFEASKAADTSEPVDTSEPIDITEDTNEMHHT